LQILPHIGSYFLTVAEDVEKVFAPAPLAQYSFRQRFTIRLADLAFYSLIRLIGATTRFEAEGEENIAGSGRPPIMVFWHDRIFLATYYFRFRKIAVLTSQSFDGEYIARFIQRLGYGAVRGSSTRGGIGGLVQLIRVVKKGFPAGFTVDGPKGPRYVAKPGPLLLAKKTGSPVVPFIVESARYKAVGSWDKMQIPLPFSRARVFVGEPICVPADADEAMISEKLGELQTAMDHLVEKGRVWREGL
jgi:lysophospholipid acyltransferase (LPLAT)-like uncharacterized protein